MGALNCATNLQQVFLGTTDVPERVGLHVGEVVFRDNNVFGHTINVTSRIESLGIAGAILMSSDFKNQIENNSTFDLKWLGSFSLRNVTYPVLVYASANEGFPVPRQVEVKGKIINKEEYPMQEHKKNLYWLLPIILGIGLGGWLWQWYQSPKIDGLILKKRIAVLPFENNTNDPSLAILGSMASNWINTGLMDLTNAEVVSPFTVRTHKDAIGILADNPQNQPTFAELTGAQNLITGAYYKHGNNVIFKLELVDALDGKLQFSFDEVKGKADQKEILLAKLREQVTGYWVAKDLVDTKKIAPPNIEAYQLYLASLQKRGTEAELLKILAIDSTFYLPRIHFINISIGTRLGLKQQHFEFLNRHIDQLSAYEKAWFTYAKGLYLGEPKTTFNDLNTIRQKYPKDFLLNHFTANIALNGLHNPKLALTIYQELPLTGTPAKTAGIYWNERLLNMVTSFIELNQLEKISDLLGTIAPNPELDNNIFLKTKLAEALVANNNALAYEQLKATLATKPYHYFWVNIELMQSNLLTDEFRQQQEADLVKAFEKLGPQDINYNLWRNFMAMVANQESYLNLENLEQLPIGAQIGNIAAAGQFYINNGQFSKVPAYINQIQKYTNCDYSGQVSTTCGAANYFMGLLQAQIGEESAAIENLQKAKTLGLGKELHRFQYSRYLAPLFELPEFQTLIQPVWPSVKDGEIFVRTVKEYHKTPKNATDITAQFKQKEIIVLAPFNHFYQLNVEVANNYQQQKMIYFYQLDQVDDKWKKVADTDITIGNLPYGQQKLRIKAQYLDGQFTKKILEIPVSVPRPFYMNFGFISAVLAFVFLTVYFGSNFLFPQQKRI